MTVPRRLSLKGQLVLCFSAILLVVAGTVGFVGLSSLRSANAERVRAANVVGVNVLASHVAARFEGVELRPATEGRPGGVTWAAMPAELADDLADEVGKMTGLAITIFRYMPGTGEFMREATTIELADGSRAVGTPLARGPVHDAMMAGRPYSGQADILDLPYETYYQPVTDAAGAPVGIFFAGFQTAAIAAGFVNSALEMGLATLVALAIGLGATWAFVRQRVAPLAVCDAAVTAWSRGDLDHDMPPSDRKDEFGRIQTSLAALLGTMRGAREASDARARLEAEQGAVVEALSTALARLSELDLTAEIDGVRDGRFPQGYGRLTSAFESLVGALRTTIATLNDMVGTLESSVDEMNGSAHDLARRAESQAATLAQSAAALEELSESVRSAADSATEAEHAMTLSQAAAGEAGGIVGDAVEAMRRIEHSSDQITRIIGVIDDIAFQTNLLALNAGVEAARAGDGGRGFAVVAAEVRALAQRSSDSAREISALISTSRKEVKTGSALVTRAGTALGEITGRIDSVTDRVKGIAASAREQAHAIDEINAGVRDLDEVTQQNAAMADAASATSIELSRAARTMSDRISAFRLAGQPLRSARAA